MQLKAEQSVKVLYDCALRNAQIHNLIEEIRYQIPSVLVNVLKFIGHAKWFTALPASIGFKYVFHKPEFQTAMTEENVMESFCSFRTFNAVRTIAYRTGT